EGPHQLGIRVARAARGILAGRAQRPHAPLRPRVVRAREEQPRVARRLRERRPGHPGRGARRGAGMSRDGAGSTVARLLPVLGALAYFAAGLLWLGAGSRAGGSVFAPGSAFDTSPTGLSLARRYLAGRAGRPG